MRLSNTQYIYPLIVCMKTQNKNSSAPNAVLKCSVKKIEAAEGPMSNVQLLTKTTVYVE